MAGDDVTTEIAAFVEEARRYCAFVERVSESALEKRLADARRRLLALYAAAIMLPDVEPPEGVEAGPDPERPEAWAGFGDFEMYWEVFDPYEASELVCGSLTDDLLGIYFDVQRGLDLWERSELAAIWEWRFQFDSHWGAHAVDALRVLHRSVPGGGPSSAAPPRTAGTTSAPWSLLDALASPSSKPATPRHDVRGLLAALERAIAASPATCFTVDATGDVSLSVDGQRYRAGRFETPTIAALEQRLRGRPRATSGGGALRLSVLRGNGSLTDIGSLQATAPPGALFQVASQFNCLEAPGPYIVPVHEYPSDPTQGPRASVSAFPGTFLRHYFAPRTDGSRFVQTGKEAIDLLADAMPAGVARVENGYLTTSSIHDMTALATALEERFAQIRVGLHDGIEVVLGADWGGGVENAPLQTIAQAFTSTIALGSYGRDDGSAALGTVRQWLLRAAYLGTVLGALALDKRIVVLTLIGGGVFGNPHRAIWDAIHWSLAAADAFVDAPVDVVVNVRTDEVAGEDLARVREREGSIIEISNDEVRVRR